LLRITHRVREDGNVVHEFLSSFGAKCCVEGDLFAGLDSQAARDEVLLSMAQRRGMYLKDEQLAEFRDNWPALLNPSASAAYAEASRLYKAGERVGMGGSYNADLSQSVGRIRHGPWVPTLARSTQLCSLSRHVLFTPNEVNLCMGWPSIVRPEKADLAKALGLEASLQHVSRAARRSLAGNGMMLPQVMAWLLYVFSNVARRAKLQALCVPLRLASLEAPVDSESDSDDV
jgi:hypothetical protein